MPKTEVSRLQPSSAGPTRKAGFRLEINGLRALAVTAVVLYHAWPNAVPGGFVGVDIFFVISGFLITGQLAGSLAANGSIALRTFWLRRSARLLPAAFLVIAVTLAASWFLLSAYRMRDTVSQAVASLFYAQNWALQAQFVNYLAHDNPASPLEHYWSLSLEEQFYLLWPVILLLTAVTARRRMAGRLQQAALPMVAAVVTFGSLAYCLTGSSTAGAAGYFSPLGRAWEFGAGALLALLLARKAWRLPASVGICGWLSLLASLLLIDGGKDYPGPWTLLPVLGTLSVIAAGSRGWPAWLLRSARVGLISRLSEVSYSWYLWHWPTILLLAVASDSNPWSGGVAVLLSLLLAVLTRYRVETVFWRPTRRVPGGPEDAGPEDAGSEDAGPEDAGPEDAGPEDAGPPPNAARLNGAQPGGKPWRRQSATALFGALGFALAFCLALASTQAVALDALLSVDIDRANQQIAVANPCFGAQALLNNCPEATRIPADYDPSTTMSNVGAMWEPLVPLKNPPGGSCWSGFFEGQSNGRICRFGDPEAATRIALVGDSHAAQWADPLAALAGKNGWLLTVYYRGDCPFLAGQATEAQYSAVHAAAGCSGWNDIVRRDLAGQKPQSLTLLASQWGQYAKNSGREAELLGLVSAVPGELKGLSTKIASIVDPPRPPGREPLCLESGRSCDFAQSTAVTDRISANISGLAGVLDYTGSICRSGRCYGYLGEVSTYRDDSHLSVIFAQTLQPDLGRDITRVIEGL